MTDDERAGDREGRTEADRPEVVRAEEMNARLQELIDYRDAGVLSDAELEDQKAKLHWGTGPGPSAP